VIRQLPLDPIPRQLLEVPGIKAGSIVGRHVDPRRKEREERER
jgi:hypothetical protein